MSDAVFTIREEALESMITISNSNFGESWLEGAIIQKLDEFSKHERFMIRI